MRTDVVDAAPSEREPFVYTAELDRAMLLFPVAATIRIEELEAQHARAEALGPLLCPTEYQFCRGAKNLADQREALRALGPFVRAARRLKARAAEEMAARAQEQGR